MSKTLKEKSWRKKYWASLEAKRAERSATFGCEEFIENEWRGERRDYENNPEEFRKGLQDGLDKCRQKIDSDLQSGAMEIAQESTDPTIRKLQNIIDDLAQNSGMLNFSPKLIICKKNATSHDYDSLHEKIASVPLPDFIVTTTKRIEYFQRHPKQFKQCAAHELAHIINGDMRIENYVKRLINPPNHKEEVLAERMGTIIFGNPKEYARLITKMQPPGKGSKEHVHWSTHLSTNGNTRMLHKWADILERAGVTDPITGDITDREKALDIFKISKDFAEYSFKDNQITRPR